MSVGRKTGRKPLAFITSLMVLFALVVPFIGTALATHAGPVDQVTLTPDTDSAVAGTCNEFVIHAADGGAAGHGETIDVLAYQSDTDTTSDNTIAFCDPDATGPASDLSGPQPSPLSGNQTGGGGTAISDADDSGGDRAEIRDECMTDGNGDCRFGVTSNEAGTMTVEAYAETVDSDTRETGEPFDTSTKTWTAAGSAQNIACTPATDSNPNGTRHEFQCTVTDSSGAAVPGATVSFDVTAGPNSQEITPTNCGGGAASATGAAGPAGSQTNASGQTPAPAPDQTTGGNSTAPGANQNLNACGYNDSTDAVNSPAGTDTIVAYVNRPQQPGQAAPTAGPDAGEAQTTITKTWTGAARTIDCEPETATNTVGTSHNVTCTVRDASNNPVQGVPVDFTETGPATDGADSAQDNVITNAQGQAVWTIQTGLNDAAGTSTVRGDITADGGAAPEQASNECANAANVPAPGNPAGVCFDDVTKTWTRQGPPPQAECNDGVDNDGDGRIDFGSDPDCGSVDDTTEAHFPVHRDIATNLTIRYDRNANKFKGAVGSSRKRCQVGRSVILKKVRPGPNRTVGRDTSNRKGNWAIFKNVNRGRFYAVATVKRFTAANGDTIKCLRDRSVTIKI